MSTEPDLKSKIDTILNKMSLLDDIAVIKKDVQDFNNKVNENSTRISILENKVEAQHRTINLLQRQVKQNNLICYGLKGSENSGYHL